MRLHKINYLFKQKGFRWGVRYLFNNIFSLKSSYKWQCRNLKTNMEDYDMLKKKYSYLISKTDWKQKSVFPNEKIIWTCWLQGEEYAPDIVKICWNSVKVNLKDYKLVVITSDNIDEYVQFPKYIYDKYKSGYISSAHFTDLLRLELLEKYGGIWFDATVLCTSDDFIRNLERNNVELFVYKDVFSLDQTGAISNWFIYSKINNPFIHTVKKMLYEYWKKYDYPCNYFIFHMFFMIIAEYRHEEWNNIPTFSNVPPHIMQKELFDVYKKNRIEDIFNMTSIHKLSYKFDDEKFKRLNTNYMYLYKKYMA